MQEHNEQTTTPSKQQQEIGKKTPPELDKDDERKFPEKDHGEQQRESGPDAPAQPKP